jgi:hypothetical protein
MLPSARGSVEALQAVIANTTGMPFHYPPAHVLDGSAGSFALDGNLPVKKKRKRSNRKDKGLEAFRHALLGYLEQHAQITHTAPPVPGTAYSTPHPPTPDEGKHDVDSVANHAPSSSASTPASAAMIPASAAAAHGTPAAVAAAVPSAPPVVSGAQRKAWLREYETRIADFSIKQLVQESVKFRFQCSPYVILVPNWHALREALWTYLKSIGVKKAKRSVSTKKDLIDICIQPDVQFDFSEFVKDAESHGNRKEKGGDDSMGLNVFAATGAIPSSSKPARKKMKLKNEPQVKQEQRSHGESTEGEHAHVHDHDHDMGGGTEGSTGEDGSSMHPIHQSPATSAAQANTPNTHHGAPAYANTGHFVSNGGPASANGKGDMFHSQHSSAAAAPPALNNLSCQDVIHQFLNLAPQEYNSFKAWFYVNVVQRENPGLNITVMQPTNGGSQHHSHGGHLQHQQHGHHSHAHHHHPPPQPQSSHAHQSQLQSPMHSHHHPPHQPQGSGMLQSLPNTPLLGGLNPPLTPSQYPISSSHDQPHGHLAQTTPSFQQWSNSVLLTPMLGPGSTPLLAGQTPLGIGASPGLFSPSLDPLSASAAAAAQQAAAASNHSAKLQQKLLLQQQRLEKLRMKRAANCGTTAAGVVSDEDDETDDSSEEDDEVPDAPKKQFTPFMTSTPNSQLNTPMHSPMMPPPSGPSPLLKRTMINMSALTTANPPSPFPNMPSPSLRALYRATAAGSAAAGISSLTSPSPLLAPVGSMHTPSQSISPDAEASLHHMKGLMGLPPASPARNHAAHSSVRFTTIPASLVSSMQLGSKSTAPSQLPGSIDTTKKL